MKHTILALAAVLALTALANAATTTLVTLSPTTYTDLGAGPMTLGAVNGGVLYQQSATPPAAGSPSNYQPPGQPPAPFTGASHVWALGSTAATQAIVTTGADVFAASSGGTVTVAGASGTPTQTSVAVGTSSGLVLAAAGATNFIRAGMLAQMLTRAIKTNIVMGV